MKYKGIKNVDCRFSKTQIVKRKGLHFFTCLFMCVVTFSCYGVSLGNIKGLKDFIYRVTSNWTPKVDDFGKIKFVNFTFDELKNSDGIFMVSSPFKNYYATNITDTILQVNGLGDVVVQSPIDGVVLSVLMEQNKVSIALSCNNIIVYLKDIDYACVEVGQKVKSKDKIAVSLSSKITFSIVCNGEYISLPAGGCADTFFE